MMDSQHTNDRPQLLFLQCGSFSNCPASLRRAWAELDIPADIHERDIESALLGTWGAKFRALPHALANGGPGVLRRGTGAFKDGVKRSPWYIHRMERAVAAIAAEQPYDLALVLGTMIPGYMLDCPYFVFTDMPILANYAFPDGAARVRFWAHCLPYERRNLRCAERVFTMGHFARNTLCSRYLLPASRAIVVGAGCNSPIVPPDPDCRAESRNILFVGLDWRRKGGPELLEAFQRVRRRVPNATLTIVGCTPAVSTPGVHVIGRVPPEQVSHFYETAALFCMPSRREPFGIVYLEAMQAGLPVIASDCGATSDFVHQGITGYRVRCGDTEELARRLEELLLDPAKRRDMGRRGRVLVETEFTWQRTGERVWEAMASAGNGWAAHERRIA